MRIARSHHERLDGSGYPDGISGDQLDRPSRILAVSDVFDAMTSDRTYKKGISVDAAIAELKTLTHHYDSDVISALAGLHAEGVIDEIMRLDREGKLTGELHV